MFGRIFVLYFLPLIVKIVFRLADWHCCENMFNDFWNWPFLHMSDPRWMRNYELTSLYFEEVVCVRADEVPNKPKLLPLVHKYDLSTLAIHRKRARPLRTWRCGRLGRASGPIRRCLFYQKKSAAGSQAENSQCCLLSCLLSSEKSCWFYDCVV